MRSLASLGTQPAASSPVERSIKDTCSHVVLCSHLTLLFAELNQPLLELLYQTPKISLFADWLLVQKTYRAFKAFV